MNPLAINLIRTYVPVAVGAAVAWLTARGIHVQPGQSAQAVTMMTAVFSAAYYTIVRVLEERWPAVGSVLLLSRPAASLHVAGACPGVQEDYGDGWPPRDDVAPQPGPGEYHFPPSPSGSQVVFDQGAAQSPAPVNDTRPDSPGYGKPAAPPARSFAPRVAPTGPNPVRKAHTGEIPAYRRHAGR